MINPRYRWTLTNLSDPNNPVVLTKDPDGWDGLICKLHRDAVYHGVFVDFTTALKFHCTGGGKQFIDTVYNNEDVNAVIELLIEFNCDGSDEYSELYTGRINLASYKTDGEYTICNIERSELFSKIKSRENISVDLESTLSVGGEAISAVSPTVIPTPSMTIKYEDEWRIADGYQHRLIETFNGTTGEGYFITPRQPLYKDDFDTTSAGYEFDEFGQQPTDGQDIEDSFIQPLFQFDGTLNGVAVDVPITLNWSIDWEGRYTIQQTVSDAHHRVHAFKLLLIKGNNKSTAASAPVATELYSRDFALDQDAIDIDFAIVQSGTFDISPGEKVWLTWMLQLRDLGAGASGTPPVVLLDTVYERVSGEDSFFKFDSQTTYNKPNGRSNADTECKTLLVHEAFNQVVDLLADVNGSFYSGYYGRTDSEKLTYGSDGCGSLRAITNGLCLREFDRPIFCSLKDLFISLAAIDNIGMTIENDDTVRVEKLSYFYDNTTLILNLTGGVKVVTTNDNTLYFNRILIGYDKWDTEFKGGLQEPNAKHEYSTLVNAINGDYTRLSKYLASAYAIELTRRKNISRFPDDDFRYDNDNFFIQVTRDPYVSFRPELLDDAFDSGSGMDSISSAYNLRLTPARMLLAHIGNITAALQRINGDIKFVRGDGNTLVETELAADGCQENYNGVSLAESDSITWDDANAANIEPLWIPERISFEYPLTVSQLVTLRANPHGYIQVVDDHGNTHKGFIMNADFEMKTGKTKFELLKMFE